MMQLLSVSALARPTNPVISVEFAQRISNMSTSNFDIHVHLADMFAGKPPTFIADVYTRLAWFIDNSTAQALKNVAGKLPTLKEGIDIDNQAELQNALDEMWGSENNSFEVGHESTGALHRIMACLNVRTVWHDHAQLASVARGRHYSAPSLDTVIGTPRRQVINGTYRANFKIDALTEAKLLTDSSARLLVDQGINLLDSVHMLEQRIRADNALKPLDVQAIAIENNEDRKAAINALVALPAQVHVALDYYASLVNEQEANFERWYENDLKRIPVMMAIRDFCNRKMLNEAENTIPFHMLPNAVQVDACAQAGMALRKTLAQYAGKPVYVRSEFKLIVEEALKLLDRVIAERCE